MSTAAMVPVTEHHIDPTVMIHQSAYVDKPVEIGPETKLWHFTHVLAGTRIGANCMLAQNVMAGPDVEIGNDCRIHNNVSIYKGVTLAEYVFCGPSCVFTNDPRPRAEVKLFQEFVTTTVGLGATIGANATIVCGHRLGEYCMIAAGAVVTSDVPSHALVAGVPARQIGWVSRCGDRLGQDLVCQRTGERFREIESDGLKLIQ